MKIATLTVAFVLAAPLSAQQPRLPANIEKLALKAKETTEVTLDGPLLKLAARFLSDKDTDQAQARKALEGIDGIYVHSFAFDTDTAYNEADLNELRAQYRAPEWSRIVGVRGTNSGDNADVYFKVTAAGQLGGIAIIAAGPRELTVVSITGNIDPAQFILLGGEFHIPRLDLSPQAVPEDDVMIRARLLVVLLAAAGIASAGKEFDDLVKAIETHYGATRTHIPLMGLANVVLKVGHPAGTSGFHIALFQDLKTDLDEDTQLDLDRFMDSLPSPRLHPLIRTRSRPNGEATYIFSGEAGKTTQLLVVTFNRHEATVIEVRVNFETLIRWIQSPDLAGKELQPDSWQ